MLCIILTKNKIIAGVREKDQTELLPISGKVQVDFGEKSMLQALEQNLENIRKAYNDHLKAKGKKAQEPIPAAVAFSVGNQQKDGSLYEPQAIKDFFSKEANSHFDLVHTEHLPLSYLRGVNGDPKLADQSVVVLEALDGYLNLCYCNLPASKINGKSQGTDAFRYISFQEIGATAGLDQLLSDVVSQFSKAGFSVDERDKAALKGQLVHKMSQPAKDYTYTLTKTVDHVRIRAEVDVPARHHEEVVATNLSSLKPRLERTKLEALGVGKVVLIGNFLDNTYVKDFLSKDLSLQDKVMAPPHGEAEFPFKAIVAGLNHTAVEIALAKAEEERKRREEAARLKALQQERQLNAEREALLNEIRITCIDPEKKAEYEKQFVDAGSKLNIPSEVIAWNIDEALRSASLKIPPIQASPTLSPALTPQAVPTASQETDLPRLHDVFKIEGVLLDPEFATKKASAPKGSNNQKVIRLLESQHLGDPEKLTRFEHLYQKELTYYQELSEIQDAVEGKYYYRDFIPRHTLKEHIKKTGLDKKSSFDKLNSKEIKLILEILDEIRNLPASHANINEYNILVLQEGLWKKSTEIKFVGFTSEDCTLEKMLEKAHHMFDHLLRPKVYADLRKNLGI